MLRYSPKTLMIVGFFLVLAGAVLPWLMVLQVLKSTFFLNFFSYFGTVAGLFLGMIGAATYIREVRSKKKE